MTQKEFKTECDFHTYTGGGEKHNVIYFDWKSDDKGRGFKYGIALDIQNGTKAELIRHAFNWINNNIELPYYVRYRFAMTDAQRFKVPLSLTF